QGHPAREDQYVSSYSVLINNAIPKTQLSSAHDSGPINIAGKGRGEPTGSLSNNVQFFREEYWSGANTVNRLAMLPAPPRRLGIRDVTRAPGVSSATTK